MGTTDTRALDAIVAEKVMGWSRAGSTEELGAAMVGWAGVCWTTGDDGAVIVARQSNAGPWSPATDIAAAFEVVEALSPKYAVRITGGGLFEGWEVEFVDHRDSKARVVAPTLPEAICRAALAVMEGE